MKQFLFVAALCFPTISFCQTANGDHVTKDTLFLKNGAKFIVGGKVKLGYGSGADKTFEFIHLSDWSIAGPIKLRPVWSNHEMVIKGFKTGGTKKIGKIFYIVLGGGNLSPYWCEIDAAMDNGEVIVEGINDKKSAQLPAPSSESATDELKKLKDLYDSGALTKDEYDSAKKKVLAKI